MRRVTGKFRVTRYGEEEVRAYLPNPLPPDPPVSLEGQLERYERATVALGRLDALG